VLQQAVLQDACRAIQNAVTCAYEESRPSTPPRVSGRLGCSPSGEGSLPQSMQQRTAPRQRRRRIHVRRLACPGSDPLRGGPGTTPSRSARCVAAGSPRTTGRVGTSPRPGTPGSATSPDASRADRERKQDADRQRRDALRHAEGRREIAGRTLLPAEVRRWPAAVRRSSAIRLLPAVGRRLDPRAAHGRRSEVEVVDARGRARRARCVRAHKPAEPAATSAGTLAFPAGRGGVGGPPA
jgi:hypothetical protein